MVEDINTNLLKDCLTCCKDKLCILFNKILTDGEFPLEWKQATIIPIFKSGNQKEVSNNRPISLLPLLAKLIEKIIHTRLLNFLNRTDFFTPLQCGFRPNLGTNDSIASLLNYTYNQLNNNNPVSAIFFDLSKAFDSIDHRILKLKLHAAGINGKCLSLLENYLSDRYQVTKINNIISSKHSISFGVPQGSTLGPLLFIIFINDLPKHITNVNISLYADDTAFYLGTNNFENTMHELNLAANNFDNWCKLNRLTLNQKKTKYITFIPSKAYKIKPVSPLKIMNTPIDEVKEFKYLGVTLDSRMTFEKHIATLKQKIVSRLFTLKRIRWSLSHNDTLILYKSSVLSLFDLGCLFYHCSNKNTLQGLQTLQNKGLRIVYLKKNWPGTDIAHKNCKLLTIKARRELYLLKYAHLRSFNHLNLKNHSSRNLRSASKMMLNSIIPRNRTYEKSFIYQSTRMWNHLDEEIKLIRNYKAFVTRVKMELLQNKLNFPE